MEHVRYIDIVNEVTSELPPLPVASLGVPPLTRLPVPLSAATVILLGSAGIHVRHDPPFEPNNDLSFRFIDQTADPSDLLVSHPSPIRGPAMEDPNVAFPYQRLGELADEGYIGAVASRHLSMLGAIKTLVPLVEETGPALAACARAEGADLMMIVPLCPACHQAMGVLARSVERAGMPTVSVSSAWDITSSVRPPRTAFLDYPLGNCVGRPHRPDEQRQICRDVLALASSEEPGLFVELPYQWPIAGWTDDILEQYRREAAVVRGQRMSEFCDGEHCALVDVRTVEAII